MDYIIHRFERVTSTNDIAARMAEDAAPEGTAVIAEEQIFGRGRFRRDWCSPAGGLYLSVILRPPVPQGVIWQLGFVASLVAAETVELVSGIRAGIKWPNDILLNGRKVCGILVETRAPRVEHGRHTPAVVVGVGINVNIERFPPDLEESASSISLQTNRLVDVGNVEQMLLSSLSIRYAQWLDEGFPAVLYSWRAFDCTAGRRVCVSSPVGMVEGTASDVDSSGSLIVTFDDGETACLTAGDVMFTAETRAV